MSRIPFDKKNIKVVAFDCDGVMFDTEKANKAYYNGVLAYFGKPELTQEQFEYVHMSTVNEALAFLFSEMDNLDDVYDYCKKFSYASLIPHMEMEPALRSLLSRLKNNYYTAIATNRSNTMENVLEYHGLVGEFHLVVTAYDVEHPKPHPDQLIKIMDHFNITPGEMLYIGDSPTDENASLTAEVPFVSYGNPSLSADFHINSLSDIEAILDLHSPKGEIFNE